MKKSRFTEEELAFALKQAKTTFCRPEDFRRITTRYDKLARNNASTLALAAIVAFRR